MERGPVALFGAIVAIGIGPALWLGAQFGNLDAAPNRPPTVVSEQNAVKAPGGAGAAPTSARPSRPSARVRAALRHAERAPVDQRPPPTSRTPGAERAPASAEPTETEDPTTPPTESTTDPADPPTRRPATRTRPARAAGPRRPGRPGRGRERELAGFRQGHHRDRRRRRAPGAR